MPGDSGATKSLWMATAAIPAFPPLRIDAETDVCVVGAGIAGLTTAYLLTRAGKRVIVLDDGPVGGGETGRTTAHLASALDDGFAELERLHGPHGARLAFESHASAIHRIESIVREEAIDCGFTRLDGWLFGGRGDSVDVLDHETRAAERAGIADLERRERAPLPFDTGSCIRFPNQAQFHPLRYLAGLARAIVRDGGSIHGRSHVSGIDTSNEHPVVTTDAGATVRAGALVVATNSPINEWVAIHTKQAPYRTYAIALRIPHDAVPLGLYWDTEDPYHYVRLDRDGDGALLVVGGEDHKTGQAHDTEARFGRLEAWARARFPMVGDVEYHWSGQVLEPVDGLAYIGRDPMGQRNVYVATGDSGHGMTHGTIAGMLITDLIAGRANPWATLYDPARKSVRAMRTFVRENANVAARYVGHVTGGDVASSDHIPPGSGAVIREGLRKVAVYRDEQGTLHRYSAICPHLFCIVEWNHTESSWDCPCHGSRFDPYGQVLNGPAASGLDEVE
ncbi:MAG TPA: FAD-dependent oxidoreductase [Gemmatimonadaceae bacterium]|nr:FAD-dependent oxidoreductase [Gemmatimonadaceae bacterium]